MHLKCRRTTTEVGAWIPMDIGLNGNECLTQPWGCIYSFFTQFSVETVTNPATFYLQLKTGNSLWPNTYQTISTYHFKFAVHVN
jgi:hypothetical protein